MTRAAARPGLGLLLLGLFAAAVLAVTPWIGMEWVSPAEVLGGSASPVESKIFWQLRVPRVLVASDPGKAAQAELKKVGTKLEENFKTREAEIIKLKEALEREAMVMSRETREDKEREYRIKVNDFKALQKKSMQELKAQENKLVSQIREELKGIIEEVGKKEGYLLIIDKAVLHYYPSTIDATDQVIKKYNEVSAKPAVAN